MEMMERKRVMLILIVNLQLQDKTLQVGQFKRLKDKQLCLRIGYYNNGKSLRVDSMKL